MPTYDVRLLAKISINALNTVRIEAGTPDEAYDKAYRQAAQGQHRNWRPLYADFVEKGAYSINHIQTEVPLPVEEVVSVDQEARNALAELVRWMDDGCSGGVREWDEARRIVGKLPLPDA